ncbi:MAG: RNA 3'-terminal phosphate cyclase, partial [Nitrososphaerales archaeon]
RSEPGLRPQHLKAVTSAGEISNATLRGAQLGSTEIEIVPGETPKRVSKNIDVGTAGSVSLIAQTLIPIAMFRGIDLEAELIGGTEVPASPTIDYVQRVVLPAYQAIGGNVSIQVKGRGYYPKGGGQVSLKVAGSKSSPRPLSFPEAKTKSEVSILSVSRNLPDHVGQRQLSSAENVLRRSGFLDIKKEIDSTGSALSPGSSVLVYSRTTQSYLGSAVIGARGKLSEDVGLEAAQGYLSEAKTEPNVDANLADMIVTLLSCVREKCHFSTSRVTEHLRTNLDVSMMLTGSEYEIRQNKERGNWEVRLSGIAEKSN